MKKIKFLSRDSKYCYALYALYNKSCVASLKNGLAANNFILESYEYKTSGQPLQAQEEEPQRGKGV